ncbi:MAG: hypothetical protein ACPGTO_11775, partial [Polaribacter sp.]
PVKGVFGIDKAKTLGKYQKELKSSKMALADIKEKQKRDKLKIESLKKGLARESSNVNALKMQISKMKKEQEEYLKDIKRVLMNPEKTNQWRKMFKKLIKNMS